MDELQKIKETESYWYSMWLKEVNLAIDAEDRLAKSNELSLHRYEVGEKFIKENDALKVEIEELKEWIDECTASNIRVYTDGFNQGYKEGKTKYDSEQDKESYSEGYVNGRKDGDAICVNKIADIKDLYGILGEI